MRWIQINASSLRPLSPGARYLIGVSGGRDSVALLHWLVECGYNKLIVCHLNHRLRGRSSRADAIFVQKLAAKYDVDLALGAIDVRGLAVRTKQSIETAARDARYKFFAQVAKRRCCRTIFLGHHADDLVETFLINLFRGAGPGGLSAMRAVSIRKIDNVKLQIVRPLLGVSRERITRRCATASVIALSRRSRSSSDEMCGGRFGERRRSLLRKRNFSKHCCRTSFRNSRRWR